MSRGNDVRGKTLFDLTFRHFFRICTLQGPMFDIQTKSKNVTIAGFDLNCQVPDGIASKVFVYSLKGGNYYEDGKWYKKNLWEKVLESPVKINNVYFICTNISMY